jgi:hypothetical protein
MMPIRSPHAANWLSALAHAGRVASGSVGQGRSPRAASSPISDEALAGEEGRLPRQGKSKEVLLGKDVLELLDPVEADRHLGVDERVDRERRALRALGESLPGPCGSLRILGHDVEKDVAVDEDGQRSPVGNATTPTEAA